MEIRSAFIEKICVKSSLPEELFSAYPIVEIKGDRHVLVENHCGIKEYGSSKILINVKYGHIDICGEQLEIKEMTKEHLIISGRVSCVHLIWRN